MNSIAKWLETLNLIPFALLISAYHYVEVLKVSDPTIIAISFAIMFDLGHFQIVTLAVRYTKRDDKNLFGIIMRWCLAIATTYVSFHYHSMYYAKLPELQQFAYAAPLPAFIIILAWYYEFREDVGDESDVQYLDRILGANTSETPAIEKSKTKSLNLTCVECGRTGFKNQNSLNGHMKRHRIKEQKALETQPKKGEVDLTNNYVSKAKPKEITENDTLTIEYLGTDKK